MVPVVVLVDVINNVGEVTVTTKQNRSKGVHIGDGYIVTTCHSIVGVDLRVNNRPATIHRTSPKDDLALIYCETLVDSPASKIGSKPTKAAMDFVAHRGKIIAAYKTGRRTSKGNSGKGYYENGILVAVVIGVQSDGDEYAMSLDRILETE